MESPGTSVARAFFMGLLGLSKAKSTPALALFFSDAPRIFFNGRAEFFLID